MVKAGEIKAIFQAANGQQIALKSTYDNGLYGEYLDYKGLFASGATFEITRNRLQFRMQSIIDKTEKVIKSPGSLYHCWHVCFCNECARFGGRIYDHSQASFNEHLRSVNPDDLFTFPSAVIGS